jgi:hypothetical protein
MQRTSLLGSLTAILVLAGAPQAPARERAAEASGAIAIANLSPAPGYTARGLAQWSWGVSLPSAQRRAFRRRAPSGWIDALFLPLVQTVDAIVSRRSCDALMADPTKSIAVAELAVGADGRGISTDFDKITARQLQRARSLALTGPNAFGGRDVIACGALRTMRTTTWNATEVSVDPRTDTPERVLTAVRLRGPGPSLGFIFDVAGWFFRRAEHLSSSRDSAARRPGRGIQILSSLRPNTRYVTALSRRSCASLRASRPRRTELRPVGDEFTTDGAGTAYSVIKMEDVLITSLRHARSVVVTQPGGRDILSCARAQAFTIAG